MVKAMKTSSGKVRKRERDQTKRRKLRGTVVKMLAVMESKPESTDPVMEFLVTGRTGRRNAMADILGPNASVTSKDLPERLQSLSTADKETTCPGSSTGQQEGKEAESSSGESSGCQGSLKESASKSKPEPKS